MPGSKIPKRSEGYPTKQMGGQMLILVTTIG
jgi:hypothetical protein